MTTHNIITMPRLGETMEAGIVLAWLKQPGDEYQRGEVLAEIETDKTIVELPALQVGTLLEILAPVGSKVVIGAPLAQVSSDGDPVNTSTAAAPHVASTPTSHTQTTSPRTPAGTRLLASPNARRLAHKLGVDLADVSASGRRGRHSGADVRAAADNSAATVTRQHDTGLAIEYWQAKGTARGTPWLFLHGLFGNSATWNGMAAALSAQANDVYAIDLPGHGNSAMLELDPHKIATALRTTLRARYQGPVRLVGISLGAALATYLARIDAHIEAVYLLCPAGLGDSSNAKFINAMLAAGRGASLQPALTLLGPAAAKLGKQAVAKMHADLQASIDAMATMANAWFPAGGQGLNVLDELAQLHMPVKALFSRDDEILPWQDAANLPDNVTAQFLAAAGHMPHLDRADRVLAFLTG